jgi:alpha-galactosidase
MSQLRGRDPERTDLVRPLPVAGRDCGVARRPPPWWEAGEIRLTGRALAQAGVRLPVLNPAEALVVELRAMP